MTGMNLRDYAEQHSRQMYEEEAHVMWSANPPSMPVGAPPGPWQHNPASFAAPMQVPEIPVEAVPGMDWVSFPPFLSLVFVRRVWSGLGGGGAGCALADGWDSPTGIRKFSMRRTTIWRFRGPTSSARPRLPGRCCHMAIWLGTGRFGVPLIASQGEHMTWGGYNESTR